MWKKWNKFVNVLVILFLIITIFGSYAHCQNRSETLLSSEHTMRDLNAEFKTKANEMEKNGYDISKATELQKQSKKARENGNHRRARKLYSTTSTQKPRSLESKTTVSIPIGSEKVRVIDIFPLETGTISNDTLKNFHYYELNAKDGIAVLNIYFPVIVQEYPYTDFKFKNNKAFGSTESGQSNVALRGSGLSDSELDSRQGKILNILAQAGIGLARDFKSYDTRRGVIETRKGANDFSRSDYAVNVAIDKGIDFIGRITPHRKKGKGGLPEDESAYVAYIRETVGRYKGRVKYWQTLKEPEPRMRKRVSGNDGGLSPEDAVWILKLSYTTIKSVDKDAIVYFPGLGPPFKFRGYNEDSYLEKIIALGGAKYFDAVGFDAYVYDIEEQAVKYRSILKKYGYDKPLWVAQTGVPDVEPPAKRKFMGGGSPVAQCAYMVKAYATAFAIGLEKVFWGEFLDESLQTEAKNKIQSKGKSIAQHSGLFFTESWEMKPAYFTHRLLASVLYDFDKVERAAPDIVKFTFSDRSPIYIVWPE